ncbi:Gfo/Idh/MocA family protein [Paenibacillus eucommiae]|uniref:Dehydrogenase n=1 Tax=Paenibacillus eucommiae TaxID=1355755 RepID=A0ABS4J9J4_9BACL|nr:Gfo/Idh/MocA family oxidoreductase [Paenibacillus eucommiae]MBP1996515.1 putative dehydrogenase [Paenibacillus eucommiae]
MKARLGIIGGGIYGTKMLKAFSFASKMEDIELVALADINEEVVNQQAKDFNIKGYLDYKEMLKKENLDAVAIVTPDFLHREITLEAVKYGVHVLVQKPLDTSSQGAQDMIKAARENDLMLFVDFHKRFDPAHMQLKNDIKHGKLGNIQYGYAHMEDKIVVPSVWLKNWAQHSSPAWFLGIHFYDLIYWLLASKPKRVYATAIKDKLIGMGIDTYDSIQAKFEFENGTHFSMDSSWILPNSFPSIVNQSIRLIGSNGMTEVDSQDRGVLSAFEDDATSIVSNPFAALEVERPFYGIAPQGYTFESMLYFTKLINLMKNGMKLEQLEGSYPCGEEALVSTQMCEAVHESIKINQVIQL